MKITLLKLRLRNFKGIRSFDLEPDGQNVSVYGANEAGKSTLYDAFLWLLFNKNSDGASDFNIKTLDENNNPLPKLEHEVEALLDVDGKELTLKKTYREKWQKKRGSEEPEMTGHETIYEWDLVPVSQKEYKERIEQLCDENIFKLITNPLAFNALNWTNRRAILFDIAGDVKDADIAAGRKEFQQLLDKLDGKKFEDYKKQLAAQKKRLRDELDQIPTRIDEINRNMPEMPDVKSIEIQLSEAKKMIDEIDDQIADITKSNEAANIKKMMRQNRLHELRSQANALKFRIETRVNNERNRDQQIINDLQNDINGRYKSIEQLEKNIQAGEKAIESLKKDLEFIEQVKNNLKVRWHEENEKQLIFNDNEFVCPACKRELDPSNVEEKKEELTANFNRDKISVLDNINRQGKAKVAEIERKQSEIEEFEKSINEAKDQIESINTEIVDLETRLTELRMENDDFPSVESEIESDGDYQTIIKKIEELETIASEPIEMTSTTALKDKKSAIQNDVDDLKAQLSSKDQIDRSTDRIADLEADSKRLGSEIAKLEKEEYVMEQFTKAKIDTIEERINGKFKTVRWKMFNQLINGGVEECCECLIKGVPFPDANNAAKINSGLEIIDTLSEHYGVRSTIFIDNAEAIVKLTDLDSQIIRLVVSGSDKKLRTEVEKKETVEAQ